MKRRACAVLRSRQLGLALLALAVAGCRLPPTASEPHESLRPLWRDYQKLAPRRAMALAGDPERLWVAGIAGGAAREEDAIEAAMERCREKRYERRMRVPCLLYAVDDEVVWRR